MPPRDEVVRKVSEWLKSKVDHHVCQTCGGEIWAVGDLVFLPLVGGHTGSRWLSCNARLAPT
jgi:hypothetical protein